MRISGSLSILLIGFVFLISFCKQNDNSVICNIKTEDFADILSTINEPQLVDVRTKDEFDAGHLEKAINIDYHADDFKQMLINQLDKTRAVLIYCQSGGRSSKAAKKLESLGFNPVYNLLGGYRSWIKPVQE